MTRFIETDEGHINADHIARVVRTVDWRYILYSSDGTMLGRAVSTFDPDEHLAEVVPAAPGTIAYEVWTWSEPGGGRPTHANAATHLVVAWRVMSSGAIPVIADQHGEPLLPLMPDGKILWPGVALFELLPAAKAAFLTSKQEDWDREQARKATARLA